MPHIHFLPGPYLGTLCGFDNATMTTTLAGLTTCPECLRKLALPQPTMSAVIEDGKVYIKASPLDAIREVDDRWGHMERAADDDIAAGRFLGTFDTPQDLVDQLRKPR